MGAPPRWGAHRRSHSRRTAKLGSGGTARQGPFRPSGEPACGRDLYRSRRGIGPLAVAEECERLDVSPRQLAEFAREPVELLGPVPEFLGTADTPTRPVVSPTLTAPASASRSSTASRCSAEKERKAVRSCPAG